MTSKLQIITVMIGSVMPTVTHVTYYMTRTNK